jgi:hypothetical protein
MGQVLARKSSADSCHSVSTDNATSQYRVTPANSMTKSSTTAMSRDSSLDTFSSSSVNLRNNSSDPLPAVLPPVHNNAPSRQCKFYF